VGCLNCRQQLVRSSPLRAGLDEVQFGPVDLVDLVAKGVNRAGDGDDEQDR
jgi:hypothetical protein